MVVISSQHGTFSEDTSSRGATLYPADTVFPADTVVCHCFGVTESVIREAIDVLGASSVAEMTATTRAGGGCNGCHCRIRRMLAGRPATGSLLDVCRECGFNTMVCECRAA
jgi:bacterioferritin-associated ferredoxin